MTAAATTDRDPSSAPFGDIGPRLEATGAQLELEAPGDARLRIGEPPARARVLFRDQASLERLRRLDADGLAEAFLRGEIDVEGDLAEVLKLSDEFDLALPPLLRWRHALQLWLRPRSRWEREAIAFHYDRPPEFFLPWLGRQRCYSHGVYASPSDSLDEAIERKHRFAFDALGLEPGMEVLDMGGGWGCFVEYAGQRGVRVHAITISQEQHRFVSRLIDEKALPCRSQLVSLRRFRPRRRFDAAVFMGTFEHTPDYDLATRFLARHLGESGRVYADFCAQQSDILIGSFLRKHLWPGPVAYVSLPRLVASFVDAGFNVHSVHDDTHSYEYTVRDWAAALQSERKGLADRFGEPAVRAFLLFLRGSERFLSMNRTQAYRLVVGRAPAPLPR